MKGISSRQIAMAFTGSFLGAGFVSGQELLQFFGVFGSFGLVGMVITIFLLCVLSYFVMTIAHVTGIIEFDKIIVEKEKSLLRFIFGAVFIFFLFGVVIVMIAGAGALLNQIFNVPKIAGSLLMAICLGLVALRGAKGVLNAFCMTVPFLVVTALIISILSFCYFGSGDLSPRPFSEENPLLGNWFFSMIAFASYNMMAAISILVPIAPGVHDNRTIKTGIFQGVLQLIIVFTAILLPVILYQSMIIDAELPMLTLADKIHPALGVVYAILLCFGMFGSALSCLFGVTVRIKKMKNIEGNSLTVALIVIAFMASIAGFKNLIATLFPVCGYIGFFAMIGITMHFISLHKNKGAALKETND